MMKRSLLRTAVLALAAQAALSPWCLAVAESGTTPAPATPTLRVDKTSVANGGIIKVTGQGAPGKPVYLEIWNENLVRGSFFDNKVDKETGKKPNKLYISQELPAFYRIHVPKSEQPKLDRFKQEGKGWSYSAALKETGGDTAYWVMNKSGIDTFQVSMAAAMSGQRGDQQPRLEDKEARKRSMQLIKARYRSVDKLLAANVEVNPDGSYIADVKIPEGAAPGKYFIVAATDKKERSATVEITNEIAFPIHYMSNAGTSINLFIPFLLALAVTTFGVLMGAGGGFILNPLLVSLFPIPHNIVAGTVTPTVLFSQASGIANYSRIKFISWKFGIVMGLAMLAGGFIGPVLTDLITLDEFKFVFGWILFVLAALMLWQTTPGYIAKNKKEQAILNEFKKRAEAEAAKKA
jgi:hypothetical protein